RLRNRKGVYYTPDSVVSFIVRSVHVILKMVLNKSDGLGDKGINVLDPAAGTAAFPAEVLRVVANEYESKYGDSKGDMFSRYMHNNVYGFEEMMAPYVIGHLKMIYVLWKLGLKQDESRGFNLYLTDALDMEDIENTEFSGMESLSGESRLAGMVKKEIPINVIIGNPPYSGSSSKTRQKESNKNNEKFSR
ncbi:MAG: N-6 DNA methylase, partial [bacterium]|nr:N-6 DNA methylase [bacterium]